MNYTIDRFEGGFAVLIDDRGKIKNVPISELPDVKEGDVIGFENGKYTVDEQDTKNRKERINNLKNKLFK